MNDKEDLVKLYANSHSKKHHISLGSGCSNFTQLQEEKIASNSFAAEQGSFGTQSLCSLGHWF
jgi:hypothetical protein